MFNSRGASWGALAIYRGEGGPTFTMADARKLAASGELIAAAIQQALFGGDADQSLSGAAERTGLSLVRPGERPPLPGAGDAHTVADVALKY